MQEEGRRGQDGGQGQPDAGGEDLQVDPQVGRVHLSEVGGRDQGGQGLAQGDREVDGGVPAGSSMMSESNCLSFMQRFGK